MTLSRTQWLRALVGHYELLFAVGEAAQELADPDNNTTVKRWAVLRQLGDALAPEIDEIIAEFQPTSFKPQAVSVMETHEELEAKLLGGLQLAYIESCVREASGGAGDLSAMSVEDTEKVRAEAADRAGKRFNGRWLDAALKLLPVILPLLMKAAG